MSNLAEQLLQSASAVAALGSEAAEIAALDDVQLADGMALVAEHRRDLQAYEILLSAQIAKRSSHDFGNDGLARRNGSATPAIFIQSITGSSMDEAVKLASLGTMLVDVEAEAEAQPIGGAPPVISDLATAALSGAVSVDAAAAIRKGLGRPDEAVTAEQLREAETRLLTDAGKVSPEALLKLARVARNELDCEAIARGQKQRAEIRYVRSWQRDGMSGGSWRIPNEDGGSDIHYALQQLLASRTGGPRFPQTDVDGNEVVKSAAEVTLEDPRTFEQVLADGFVQIFLNGLRADPSVVPSAGRVPVRVMVTDTTLNSGSGSALLEGSLTAITFEKLGEYLCESGTVGVLFDDDNNVIDVGREQRLFTKRQRTGLGIRDGGCRYPGCDKPPAWTEAHHVREWARHGGCTDIVNGILLCRYHHMLIHETHSEIIREGGTYWLKPGKILDPTQTLIEMPSKNPLVAAMKTVAAMAVAATA